MSARRELIERAVELGAELVLVHHGLFWTSSPTGLTPLLAERLRPLFKHDINLAAYHLPLDAHPEVGNNALLAARARAATAHEPFGDVQGPRDRTSAATFADRSPSRSCSRACSARRPGARRCCFGAGPEPIALDRRSSRARRADTLDEAVAAGLDAFLTGEPREHIMADAREVGIHFIAAGHYATETFGVRALGELLAERFGDRARLRRHPESGLSECLGRLSR